MRPKKRPYLTVRLNREEYRDMVHACWVGKNIGGTMGTPYEGVKEYLDIHGFATEANVVLPNDDLDLQLVWLHAVETVGPHAINAAHLGEFWINLIPPHWNEYGIGKSNMKRGLLPPLSGDYDNDWKHSNGAWIRTEVWACMAPGVPYLAAKYAIEDAKVDHGAGEGTYAAAFVAAMQSAAFVIKDLRTCIEIGLAQIPATCRVADSVRLTMECYDAGKTPRETRDTIFERNADIGNGWFEAPSNVAYTILGLLYGEGDFKKSMIAAINCGDDTDCTGATVGSTLGILGGSAALPKDWSEHIGDDIVTMSINQNFLGRTLPKTCSELSDRVIAQAPYMLQSNHAETVLTNDKTEVPEEYAEYCATDPRTAEPLALLKPFSMHFDFAFLGVDTTFDRSPDVTPMDEINLHLHFFSKDMIYDRTHYSFRLRWWLPDGFSVEGKQSFTLHYKESRHYNGTADLDVKIRTGEQVEPTNRCVLEIIADGHPTPMYIPFILLA